MKQLTKSINTRKRVSEIVKSGVISEKEFNMLKSCLNRGLCKYEDIEPLFINDISLSADWMQKGLKWLRNLYKTPTGKEQAKKEVNEIKRFYMPLRCSECELYKRQRDILQESTK